MLRLLSKPHQCVVARSALVLSGRGHSTPSGGVEGSFMRYHPTSSLEYSAAAKGYLGGRDEPGGVRNELSGPGGAWEDGDGGYEWKSRYLQEKRNHALEYMTNVRLRVPMHESVRRRAIANRQRLFTPLSSSGTATTAPIETSRGDASLGGDETAAGLLADSLHVVDSDGGMSDPRDSFESGYLGKSARAARRAASGTTDLDLDDPVTQDILAHAGSAPAEAIALHNHEAVVSAIDLVEDEIDSLCEDEDAIEALAHLPESELAALRSDFYGGAPELGGSDSVRAAGEADMQEMLREWCQLRKETSLYQSYAGVPQGERREWSAWYLRDVRASPHSTS